jgi:HD-like signal output (HDOD) protein/CheY-like chemotaxis protein
MMNPTLRILFVDDEPLVLEGLRRQLRSMRNEWDMEFADSAAGALALLEASHFDVVVTDMRMPGMNGAELLDEVMKRQPQTVRLILSGYGDQGLIMKCVGSTHQCLSKPCDSDALKSAITRATILDLSLQDGPIRRLVSQLDRLPSLPKLYVELMDALGDPNTPLETVGSIIAQDIGMTAKILKLVNSAFFGLGCEISSPSEAVVYLGQATVNSLVLSMHVFSQFEAAQLRGLPLDALWEHSLYTAAAAKQIAQAMRADFKVVDETYAAGMLHDAGWLVLMANLAEPCSRVVDIARQDRITLVEAEKRVFNTTHAEVGGYLLGLWGLPVPVVEAITFHHRPSQSRSKSFCPLTAVHAGDALVQEQVAVCDGIAAAPLDLDYLQALDLSDRLEDWRAAIHQTVSPGATP